MSNLPFYESKWIVTSDHSICILLNMLHMYTYTQMYNVCPLIITIACGVMVIITGYGHGDTSSNPGRDWLHFT